MTLEELGYTEALESYRKEQCLESFGVGRVVSEHKERYDVKTENAEYNSELIGNLRFTAEDRHDFPTVGDWVAISEFDDLSCL
jgi:ribosome biogenesis GTPase